MICSGPGVVGQIELMQKGRSRQAWLVSREALRRIPPFILKYLILRSL